MTEPLSKWQNIQRELQQEIEGLNNTSQDIAAFEQRLMKVRDSAIEDRFWYVAHKTIFALKSIKKSQFQEAIDIFDPELTRVLR